MFVCLIDDGRNRSTRRKLPNCHWHNLLHKVVSNTPRHEWGTNSQLPFTIIYFHVKPDIYGTFDFWNVTFMIHCTCETLRSQYIFHVKHDFYHTVYMETWHLQHIFMETWHVRYILHFKPRCTIHVTCKTWYLRYSFTSIRWCTITRGSW